MRWVGLILLLCLAARAEEEEKVDLVSRGRAGDVCLREVETKVKTRGTVEAGRATRAITVNLTDTAEFRDTYKSADQVERHYRRLGRVTEARIAGVKPNSKNERDPLEGQTRTVAAFGDNYLVGYLDRLIKREGVAVGDRWETKDSARTGTGSGELKCKLSEIATYKKHRVAKIYVTFKLKGGHRVGQVEATARGYVWFSLDVQRIIRTKLKGPVKMVLKEIGTVYGTIQEDSTTEIEKRGEENGGEQEGGEEKDG